MIKHICALCMAAVLLAGLLTGCAGTGENDSLRFETDDFVSGEHARDSVYAQTFSYRFVTADGITFCVEDSLMDQIDASALFETVDGDLRTICDGFGDTQDVQCYILRETLSQSVCAVPGEIFCTPDDVTSGGYREGLVSASLGVTEPWIAYGAYAWLFLEKTDEETRSDLAAYYSDETNLPALSLFAGYFNTTLAGRQSMRYAKKTAAALAGYLIETYGTDALLSAGTSEEYRQEWLSSIGADSVYAAPCDIAWLDGALYALSDELPWEITKDAHVFSFRFPQDIDSPLKVMQFLADYNACVETLLDYVRSDAPDAYDTVLASWDEPLQIQVADTSNLYFAPDGHVYCDSLATALRGTLENVFKADALEKLWLTEGLAFALPVISELQTGEWYASFTTDAGELDGDIGAYLADVQAYYLARAAYPEDADAFSDGLFFEAMSAIALLHGEYDLSSFAMGSLSVAAYRHGEKNADAYPGQGNRLTCLQAYQLTRYLVDTFGLETVLGYLYGDESYDDAFSESFTQSYGNMIEALRSAQ